MTGHMPGPYWQITWRFVGPVLISVLLVASIIYRSFDKPAYYAWNAQEVSAGTAGWWAGARDSFALLYRRPWKEPIDRHPSYFLVYHLLIHFIFFLAGFQGKSFLTPYPQWVLIIGGLLATLSVLPIPVVFLLRRFQFLRLDTDINKGVIRRNETTISTKQMMTDVDVNFFKYKIWKMINFLIN